MKRFLVIAASLLCLWVSPAPVSAQTGTEAEEPSTVTASDYGDDQLEARYVGLSGGIVLGAEIVIAAQGLAGVNKLWPYLVFPVLGGAAGGIGGYYLEKTSPGGAVGLMVAGIVLIIPTAIAAASAFTFNPKKAGMVVPDNDDTPLSFELPPSDSPPPVQPATTTEVETVPPGEGPPFSEGDEEVDIEEPGDAPEEETSPPPSETDEASPETSDGPSATSRRQDSHKRNVPSGHLISVSDDGNTRWGFPMVDVRPVYLSMGNAWVPPRTGFEVLVPLLRVQLP